MELAAQTWRPCWRNDSDIRQATPCCGAKMAHSNVRRLLGAHGLSWQGSLERLTFNCTLRAGAAAARFCSARRWRGRILPHTVSDKLLRLSEGEAVTWTYLQLERRLHTYGNTD